MRGAKPFTSLATAVIVACATGAALAASASTAAPSTSLEERALAAHNAERAHLGLPRLVWNPKLAHYAADWGRALSRRGVLEHSSAAMESGQGENLWMGSAGHWQVEAMVGEFIAEKRHFRHASFPYISRTGNWADVGHYTQVVWRDTREVGCAVVSDRRFDVLVCRYYPAGNVYGQQPY